MNVFDVEAIEAQIEINKKKIDEFAVGFAEWLFTKDIYITQIKYNKKELLEIYKKEKGL